jgi:hypothetical protein
MPVSLSPDGNISIYNIGTERAEEKDSDEDDSEVEPVRKPQPAKRKRITREKRAKR